MNILEQVSEKKNTWFVDLFVRENNTGLFLPLKSYFCDNYDLQNFDLKFAKPRKAAHKLYTNLGYTVYRTILNYYGGGTGAVGEENAYDMRKSMSKDVKKETTIPLTRPVTADEIEWH